jgi:hypothetical protein
MLFTLRGGIMLGQHVEMSRKSFDPYLPDHKEGYYELDQISPGVVLCPFCSDILDATQDPNVKAAYEVIMLWPDSWASVPMCKCPGVWAVYSPDIQKWAFRYKVDTGRKYE